MDKSHIKSYVLITIGVLAMHLGFYFFLKPMALVTGGMMGLSLLLEPILPISAGLVYLVLNFGTLIIGGVIFGKDFFIKTVYASILAPVLVTLFEILGIHDDLIMLQIDSHYQLLLGSIVGGALVGVGIGLVLRYNATTGGMDVIQKMVNKFLKVPFSVAVYVTDGMIVLIGAYISIQSGIFGFVSMIMTAYILEKTAVFGRSAFALLIISKKYNEIRSAIYEKIDRGVTRIKAVGGYSGIEKEIVLTTVNRQELYTAKDFITEIDPEAFTLIISTKEVLGAGFHRDDLT